jgi:hypothetical protein
VNELRRTGLMQGWGGYVRCVNEFIPVAFDDLEQISVIDIAQPTAAFVFTENSQVRDELTDADVGREVR